MRIGYTFRIVEEAVERFNVGYYETSKFLHRSWLMRLTSDPDSEAENVDLHGLQSIH